MTTTASATELSVDRGQLVSVAAEIALAVVTLTAIASLGRLFDSSSYITPLVTTAVVAHVAAMALRRTRLSPLTVALLAVVGGAVVLGWVRYLDTTFLGLPTRATLTIAREDLSDAWTQFGEVIAPAPPLPGFVLGSCIAVWVAAWVADWAAFRLGSAVEAVLPATAIVVFAALLGDGRNRTITTVAFVSAALGFVLLHRVADQVATGTWVGNGRNQGPPAVVALGLGMVVLAVTFGAIAGPRTPGAGAEAMLDWHGGGIGDGTRVTVSPLVDIRKRLVDQSDVEAFSVRATRRSYWRLTALDDFDGQVWQSSGQFSEADGGLPGGSDLPSTANTQKFAISGLQAIWLPAAFEPVDVRTNGTDVRYDDESSTLIVDQDLDSSDGVQYTVTSALPELTRELLDRNDGADVPRSIADRYLRLPEDFPPAVDQLARETMSPGANPYQRALLLQNYFRDNFTYDLDGVGAGHSEDAIQTFLDSKKGYCEQFAGTFAAMARSQGLPARVAVGFTPGAVDERSDGNRYIVRGRNAHAWPEVYINQAGWVPFEPTPGRGAPGNEEWTGVAEQQDNQDPVSTSSSVSTATTETIPNTIPTSTPGGGPDEVDTAGGGSTGSNGPLSPLVRVAIALGVAVLLVAAWVALLAAGRTFRARNRRRHATTEAAQVRVAWLEGTEAVSRVAPPLRPAETHAEFAARVRPVIGPAARPLARLAGLATASEWSDAPVGSDRVHDARDLSREIDHEIRESLEPRQRFLAWFDPRPLFRS